MIALDEHCREILLLLLQSEHRLAAAEIASRLNITARMVGYRLRAIERWLGERNVRLVKRPGYGILIDVPAPLKRDLVRELEQLRGYPLLLSPAERLHILILSLLTSERPLLVKQFQSQLRVSRTTVLKDMAKVEAWLEKRNLHLVRRPHFGFKVAGRETDWREAAVGFLVKSAGRERLLPLCRGSPTAFGSVRAGDVGFGHALSVFLQSLELAYCRKLVALTRSAMPAQFTDISCATLVLYLAVLIRRIQAGNTVQDYPDHLESLRERRGFSVARMIAERIGRNFQISLGEPEIAYMATRLSAAEIQRDTAGLAGQCATEDEIDPRMLEIVDGILAKAFVCLHPYLRGDQELIRNLALHLGAALDKLRFDLPIRNPLLEDVKKQYPHIFEVARQSSTILEDVAGKRVPDEEIAYIAMHLAAAMERLRLPSEVKKRVLVVCEAGIATAWLLVSRLQAEFPDVEIVKVMSVSEMQGKAHLDNIDAIVTTISTGIKHIPSIVVSPFLKADDLTRLRQVLGRKSTLVVPASPSDARARGGASLADLITDETIRLQVSADKWQKVVHIAGKLLLDVGAIEARYTRAMQDIIVQHGPYMITWPGIALLHAHPRDGVRRLCMSLVTLREPVDFGQSESAPVDLVVAIGATDNRSHLRALSELQGLLQDQEAVASIRSAVHNWQVIRLILASSRRSSRPPD